MSCMGDDKYCTSNNSRLARKTDQGGLYFAVVQIPSASTTMAAVEGDEDFCDVKKVAKEFRLREDGALALQLQETEFQNHYSRNKTDRHTARVDVKAAKIAYIDEVRDCGLLTENQIQNIGMDDAWLSNEIEARIAEQEQLEEQNKSLTATQDEEYAKYLQMKEKEKIELARKRRLQKRLARDGNDNGAILSVEASKPPSTFLYDPARSGLNGDLSVMRSPSEPPRVAEKPLRSSAKSAVSNGESKAYDPDYEDQFDMEDRQRESQENQDEKFARMVQEEELVRQKRITEDRDRRLALKLQKIETSEYKRQRSEDEARKALAMSSTKPPHPEYETAYDSEKKERHRDDNVSVTSTGSGSSRRSYDSQSDNRGGGSIARQGVSVVKTTPGASTGGTPSNSAERRGGAMERAYTVGGGGNPRDYEMARKERDPGYQSVVTVTSDRNKSQSMKAAPMSNGGSNGLRRSGSRGSQHSTDSHNMPNPDYPGARGISNIAEAIDPTYQKKVSKDRK